MKMNPRKQVVLRSRGVLVLLAGLLALFPVASRAQETTNSANEEIQPAPDPEVPLVDRFLGDWEGTGKLFGMDAAFRMSWERALGGKFVRLTFQNRMLGQDGTERVLDAQAFYKPTEDGRFEGTWFDSRGVVLPLQASTDVSTLTTLWGSPETERGRTVYRLTSATELEVEDSVWKDDQWHPFGSATYKRVSDDP